MNIILLINDGFYLAAVGRRDTTAILKNMFERNNQKLELEKEISKIRKEKLKNAVEIITTELSPEELSSINAIILYGSTALDKATEKSDLDIFIAYDSNQPITPEILKKIQSIIKQELPDISFQFSLGTIGSRRSMKSVTVRSLKHPERVPGWDFLYAKDENIKTSFNSALSESQRLYDKIGLNQPPLSPKNHNK